MAVDIDKINKFLSEQNLKRTVTGGGVYFEQKITPDLMSFIAKVIIEFTNKNNSVEFTNKDIRSSDFFSMMIKDFFSKPSQSEKTENEYNKLSPYQTGLLAFAGVLEEIGNRPKVYRIKNLEILEFIAQSEMNALIFLERYVVKLLEDNGLTVIFDEYKKTPIQESYVKLKKKFWEWAKINTSVRGTDPKHTNRVFNKIFNLFAHFNSLPGQHRAMVRPGICPYSYLIYNSLNWRDKNKPKSISRKQFQEELEKEGIEIGGSVAKSKALIKKRHFNTEVIGFDKYAAENNPAIQIHHIFPSAYYRKYSDCLENLISLSVGQHMSYAHEGNTHWVNPKFQIICLLSKLKSIEDSLSDNEDFYDLDKFIEIINTGLSLEIPKDSSIETIRDKLLSIKEKL